MSFQTALSGLGAASRSLDVIGNNIANANTTGMKASRTEFADVVASSIGLSGGNNAGLGVSVETVSQLFSQGNITVTGNNLDIAVNGSGFFQLTMPDGTMAYTRAGNFKLDRQGNIITNAGAKVMGYTTDKNGVPTSATTSTLKLPTSAPIPAAQTTTITAEFNLDARAPVAATASPPTPRTTYGTALTTYDSQGVPLPVNLYFEKITPATAGTDEWAVFDALDTTTFTATSLGSLVFDATGQLTSPSPATLPITLTPASPSVVPAFAVTIDFATVTQFGAGFAVSSLTQDGYPPGELSEIKIGENGVISARYSNGQTKAEGMIALADFRNVQGLSPIGGNNWVETYASDQAILGRPGQGKYGATRSGSLEDSTVDLTAELVSMMTAQRAYQANAQTIKTQDQVMQTLVNLR